ncbi:hypothetical protein PVAG01_04643 [Phlyctema vagabunda]|uniref:Mmc1 C-terminal domain-containing protein n=1 Tax=Phlyctema vagabunda TaxID=108571 RepID=A0ABR4PHT3_9HELO
MPPRITKLAIGLTSSIRPSIAGGRRDVCLICSLSRNFTTPNPQRSRTRRSQLRNQLRNSSSQAEIKEDNAEVGITTKDARNELHGALLDLQKQAGSYVNISRLQLALRGLEQQSGQETIRVAILALANGGTSLRKAKKLLRLIAADPLGDEEEWERTLVDEQGTGRPLLMKIGHNTAEEFGQSSRLLQQLNVNSPTLNGHKLEILVLETDPPSQISEAVDADFRSSVLVPTMEIPTSSTGRYTPVTTPVHRAIIVGDGLIGASRLLALPSLDARDSEITWAAMDLQTTVKDDERSLSFPIVDTALATSALGLFRQSVNNALRYEQDWFSSGVPVVVDWLKSGSGTPGESMKEPLRSLISSLIENTYSRIDEEERKGLGSLLADTISSKDLKALKVELSAWSEFAHTELRDDLDVAFEGRRWRKLGWWKLFWRVDDVSMIATDILSQRFLTFSEKSVIFLSGRIIQSGVVDLTPSTPHNWAYQASTSSREEKFGSVAPDPTLRSLVGRLEDEGTTHLMQRPWPLHIPLTRGYLSNETVPALQALAQKLVLQTLSSSSFASAVAGLVYVSSFSTGLYEAGAVAALGIVWSLRRMQNKWETARKYWEGEVREEGRKAVRATESDLQEIFQPRKRDIEGAEELERVKASLSRAEIALKSVK